MAITEDDRIRSSPRASKDPNSFEYARQTVYALRRAWESVKFNSNYWQKEIAEAEKNKIWLNHKPPYESLEHLLVSEVGYTESDLQKRQVQVAEASLKPMPKKGGDRKSKEAREADQSTNSTLIRGCNTDYTLRRLARDGHEDLLASIAAGDVSVNQAAIQVGYRKKPTPEEICVRAFQQCDDRTAMLDRLTQLIDDSIAEQD